MAPENFAQTFKQNVSNAMKLFQDSTKAIIEAQSKQIEFTSGIYTKSVEAFDNLNKNNVNDSFGTPEKVTETIQKNFESISNLYKETLKGTMEYIKQANQVLFSKKAFDEIIENYTKQVKDIASFSQKYVDVVSKQANQANTTKPFFNSDLTEKFKKNFDANVELLKEQMRSMVNSYSRVTNPSFEATEIFFNKLNEQVETSLNANLKLWSNLINTDNAKKTEAKNGNGIFNKQYNGNNGGHKKQEFTTSKQ